MESSVFKFVGTTHVHAQRHDDGAMHATECAFKLVRTRDFQEPKRLHLEQERHILLDLGDNDYTCAAFLLSFWIPGTCLSWSSCASVSSLFWIAIISWANGRPVPSSCGF